LKINIQSSDESNTQKALSDIIKNISDKPDLLMIYNTVTHDSNLIQQTLVEKFPNTQIAGSTTCLGIMTNRGMISKDSNSIGIIEFNLENSEVIGVGICKEEDAILCARNACESSILKAELEGELPSYIWYMGAPGHEESLIKGIDKYFGTPVPFFGGSAADNDISGKWCFYNDKEIYSSGALLISFFTEDDKMTPLSSFHCGYTMQEKLGKVTKYIDREVIEIDGKRAISVYDEKTKNNFKDLKPGTNILQSSVLLPVGRLKHEVQNIPFYLLSHPATVTENGGFTLFTDVEIGDELFIMNASKESIKTRTSEVLSSLLDNNQVDLNRVSGVLVVFCAGLMLSIFEENGIDTVASGISKTLGDIPFLGTFSFGEQGRFVDNKSLHGNLMISVTVFFKDEL
jgi:hypothetical protein